MAPSIYHVLQERMTLLSETDQYRVRLYLSKFHDQINDMYSESHKLMLQEMLRRHFYERIDNINFDDASIRSYLKNYTRCYIFLKPKYANSNSLNWTTRLGEINVRKGNAHKESETGSIES